MTSFWHPPLLGQYNVMWNTDSCLGPPGVLLTSFWRPFDVLLTSFWRLSDYSWSLVSFQSLFPLYLCPDQTEIIAQCWKSILETDSCYLNHASLFPVLPPSLVYILFFSISLFLSLSLALYGARCNCHLKDRNKERIYKIKKRLKKEEHVSVCTSLNGGQTRWLWWPHWCRSHEGVDDLH